MPIKIMKLLETCSDKREEKKNKHEKNAVIIHKENTGPWTRL